MNVTYDGDDYSEQIPTDIIIRKPTLPPDPLGSTSGPESTTSASTTKESTTPRPTTTPEPVTTPASTTTPEPVTTPAPTTTPDPVTTPPPTTTPEPVTTPPPTTTPEPVTTPGPTTTPEPVTTSAPTVPVCPMPERPAQLTGVMGFGHDLNSHAAYDVGEKGDVLYKLISDKTRLSFQFRASNPNGIMLYTANEPAQLDFIECHLEDSKVSCSFCTGGGILKLSTTKASYSDGQWHTVRLMRKGVNGTLYVDDKKVDSGKAGGSPLYINALKVLFLGGVPQGFNPKRVPEGSRVSFPGCIRSVTVSKLDIGLPTAPFKMQDCYRDNPESGVSFEHGGGYLEIAKEFSVGQHEVISLEIKPTSHTGLLLLSFNPAGDYIVLEMISGTIRFVAENGGGPQLVEHVPNDPLVFCDGMWHKITVKKENKVVRLIVNDIETQGGGTGAQSSADMQHPLYIGGKPDDVTFHGVTATESYTGCIRNFVAKDPGRSPKKLSVTNPLVMSGNVYLGGCPYK